MQALRYPLRQVAALYGIKLYCDAKAFERAKPGAFDCHAVEAGQDDQRERGVIAATALRALGNLLQGGRAIFAGLATGNANFNDLFIGKKA